MEQTIDRIETSYDSIKSLLTNLDSSERTKFHRQSIIDSYLISQFQSDYSKVYESHKQSIVNNEILAYNKKLGQMFKLNYDIENITKEFESKQGQIKLPDLKVSLTTIQEFDVDLYERIIENGSSDRQVNIEDIFSLEGDNALDFEKFKTIINIEYKKRMARIIKYELLLKIKRDIGSINSKWGARNEELDKFITKDLTKIIQGIEEVRNIEFDVGDEDEEEALQEEGLDEEGIDEDNIEDDRIEEDDHIEEDVGEDQEDHIEDDIDEDIEEEQEDQIDEDQIDEDTGIDEESSLDNSNGSDNTDSPGIKPDPNLNTIHPLGQDIEMEM